MGKRSFTPKQKERARYLPRVLIVFILILILTVSSLGLPLLKAVRDADTAEEQAALQTVLAVVAGGFLLFASLKLIGWLLRRTWPSSWLTRRSLSNRFWQAEHLAMTILVGVACLSVGIYYAFDLSHQLTSEWWQIRRQPALNATELAAAPVDSLLVVTGNLAGNAPISPLGYVACVEDKLSVYPCDPTDNEDCLLAYGQGTGMWVKLKQSVPGLTLTVSDGRVHTLPVAQVTFGGNLREEVVADDFEHIAFTVEYNGQILSDGSLRTRGLENGDQVTIVGHKISTGELIPDHLIGGGEDALVAHFRPFARYQIFLRVMGFVMIIGSPIVTLLFWRSDW